MDSRTRSFHRLRWLTAGLVIAAATLWMARDLPRRLVQTMVADLLQGQVRLEGFRIEAWRELDLLGLEVKHPAILPMVERVAFGEVRIEGRFGDLLAGRVERLTLRGMEARLITSVELEEGPSPEVSIAELRMEPAKVTVVAESGMATALTLDGSLRDIGGDVATGDLSIRSQSLDVSPLLELAALWAPQMQAAAATAGGRLDGLEADLVVGDPPHLKLQAERGDFGVGDLVLRLDQPRVEGRAKDGERFEIISKVNGARLADASRQVDLGAVGLTVTATPIAGVENLLRVEIGAELEMVDEARLAVGWDRELGRLAGFEGNVRGFDLGRLTGGVRVDGDADLEIHGEGADLVFATTIRPHRLASGSASLAAEGALLTVGGRIPLENLAATPPKLESTVQVSLDLPSMTGTFADRQLPAMAFPARAGFDGDLVGVGDDGPALDGTWKLNTAAAGRVAATGGLRLENSRAGLRLLTADLVWTWRGGEIESLARFLEQAGLIDDGELPAGGRLSGRGSLRGALSDPEVHAELKLEGATVELGGALGSLEDGTAAIVLDWHPYPRPPDLHVREAAAVVRAPDREPIPFTLRAALTASRDLGSGELTETVAEAPGLGLVEVDGRWRLDSDRVEADGSLHGQQIDLGGWQTALRLSLADMAFKGLGSTELQGSVNSDGWRLEGPLEVAGAGFSSADGGRVLEGLAADWTISMSGGSELPFTAKATGSSSGFLVLWDTFFADLSGLEADWRIDAAAETADQAWRLAAGIAVPGGPAIEGTLRRPAAGASELDYTLDVRVDDLALTHDRYLRAILDQRFDQPELGGELTANLRGVVDPGDGAVLAGELHLEGLRWQAGEELTLTGFDLDLPLDLHFGSVGGGERRRGRVSFDRLSFRGLELPPTETGLWTENDGLELEEPLSFQILEGSITLGQLKLGNVLDPGRYLESSLSLTGLSLGKISQALELFPVEGTLEGRLPRVRLSAAALRVEGDGEIGVFGGSVRLKDISGKDVLTPFPSLTMSADFSEVDLGRLTRRLDFGEMTGVLQGSITDCELFRKVPVRCSARFETVTRPGVSRTVDVKAINNLSILGTGAGTNVFDRGLQRFFDRYRYERLGVEIRLDNDVLSLRGLEKRGERELFMKGRFPFSIDIVNVQPGRTVSFQAMMRRLQNLDFSTATASPKQH